MKKHKVNLPKIMSLGGWKNRGTTSLYTGTKPPKLRARPGDELMYEGKLHFVSHIFRLKNDPHEWKYVLEEKKDPDKMSLALDLIGAGSKTPRVVTACFRDSMEAFQFFSDIPANGDRTVITNKKLVHILKKQ